MPSFKARWLVAIMLTSVCLPASAKGQDVKPTSPWRLALACSSTSENANNLLDLVQAKLSAEANLELLDRKTIRRILGEQKVSLSGLVDANMAVQIGKLLRADTFALLETDPLGKEVLGLVIYDTVTGIKWLDQTLASGTMNKQVEAVVAGVRSVAKKRSAGSQSWRTVCILSTRNADLPHSQDHIAPTVARLLERHLLTSASLAVLERKRLDWVNKEKNLATTETHKELLASLVTVEVEVSRAEKGIRATAHLSDPRGKDLGKIRAESAASNTEELANGLLAGIVRALQAAPAGAPPDRRRESQRFFQEGQRLTSYRLWHEAMLAFEAAYALDPASAEIRAALAKALVTWGHWTLAPQANGKNNPLQLAKPALVAGQRGYELRHLCLQQTPATTAGRYAHERAFFDAHFMLYPFTLKFVPKEAMDDEFRELRRLVFATFLRVARAELDRAAQLAMESPPKEREAFHHYVFRLSVSLMEIRYNRCFSAQEEETVSLDWLERWREMSQAPGRSPSPADVNLVFQDPFDQAPRFAPFYEALSKHADPLVRLWGRYLLASVRLHEGHISLDQAESAYQDIKRSALQAIASYQPPAQPLSFVKDDFRHGCYEFLFRTTSRWSFRALKPRHEERFALCEYMLRRKELVLNNFLTTVQKDPRSKKDFHRERWNLIEQAQLTLASGNVALLEYPDFLRQTLVQIQSTILRERPDFATRQDKQATPWKHARRLLRPEEIPHLEQIGPAMVRGNHILVPICRADSPQSPDTRVEVLQIPWKEKGKTTLAGWTVPKVDPVNPFRILCYCWGDGRYFLGTTDGIYAIDEHGTVRHLTKQIELPGRSAAALAYRQGKLFAYFQGGYFIALDPQTGQFETLASSRRRERLSPFDDGEPFRILGLHADPDQDRLLILLYQRPNVLDYYAPDTLASKDTTNGLWEYNLKTKKFTRHLELYLDVVDRVAAVQPGHWLLSKEHPLDNVLDFHLKTNKAQFLLGHGLLGPHLRASSPKRRQPAFPWYHYFWHHDGFLWGVSPHSFGRVSLKDGRLQSFSGFGTELNLSRFVVQPCLARVGPDHLLVQNLSGLWLLELPRQRP